MRDARSGRIRPSRSPSPAPSPTACSTACRAARCVREATTWPTSSPARGGESAPTSGVCGARTSTLRASTQNGGGIDGLHRSAACGAGDDQRGAGTWASPVRIESIPSMILRPRWTQSLVCQAIGYFCDVFSIMSRYVLSPQRMESG